MLKLIYYQFQHNKKQWLGIAPVIFISSLIVGLATKGYISVDSSSELFLGLPDPKPIFMFPIVFGGITLFFVISTLIDMLINMFRDDYTLLSILGASRFQLSFLVGGQIFVITSIISFIAYFCSIPITSTYYHFLQYFFGKNTLPDIPFQINLIGCLITVLLISFLSFFSGFFHTYRLIEIKKNSKIRKVLSALKKGILLTILILISAFMIQKTLQGDSILMKAQMIFNMVIIDIIIIYQLSPYIQTLCVKLRFCQ